MTKVDGSGLEGYQQHRNSPYPITFLDLKVMCASIIIGTDLS